MSASSGSGSILVIDGGGVRRVEGNPNDLATLQALVGGYIEAWPLDRRSADRFTLYVNEEGLLRHLTTFALFDGFPVYGPLVFVGPADEEGDQLPLPSSAALEADIFERVKIL